MCTWGSLHRQCEEEHETVAVIDAGLLQANLRKRRTVGECTPDHPIRPGPYSLPDAKERQSCRTGAVDQHFSELKTWLSVATKVVRSKSEWRSNYSFSKLEECHCVVCHDWWCTLRLCPRLGLSDLDCFVEYSSRTTVARWGPWKGRCLCVLSAGFKIVHSNLIAFTKSFLRQCSKARCLWRVLLGQNAENSFMKRIDRSWRQDATITKV